MTKIIGNNDGPGGRNETYEIGSRKVVPRRTTVSEVKQGRHPARTWSRSMVVST